jgi:CheY-like chemotaxis protein
VATALKLVDTETFDLLLSDLGLPDGSGVDLMREIRQHGSKLPGIALSGYGRDSDIQQSRDAGFVAHLTKPVDVQRLERTIECVVNKTKTSNPDP